MRRLSQIYKLQLTPAQIMVVGFAIIIFIGTFLLTLPIASTTEESVSFIDALFTATSASTVTGLVVVETGTQYTIFGQIVILTMIQVGGIGFMTMATLFALIMKKRISLRDRLILQASLNQMSMEGIVRLIRKVILYSIVIESVAAVILAIRWYAELPLGRAIYYGIFHAISIFNNACFDLMGTSLIAYTDDVVINVVSMVLIVTGGLGFIVISDVLDYKKTKRLSLHTRVVLSVSAFLIVGGTVVIFILEFSNPVTLGQQSWTGKVLASFFQSVTPRSAGASTVNLAELREVTQFFLIALMFIGASPGSAGGGIKTTTFAILIAAMVSMLRGRRDIILFRHRLEQETIFKAITMTLLFLFLIIFVSVTLSIIEPTDHFLMILFEVTSAFSTVGLSLGLTPELSTVGKMLIIMTMFIGRVGPLTMAYALGRKSDKELYRHPEGKIMIG